jgi:hypothetical protein
VALRCVASSIEERTPEHQPFTSVPGLNMPACPRQAGAASGSGTHKRAFVDTNRRRESMAFMVER